VISLVLLVIVVYSIIAFIEVPPLVQNQQKKELILYSFALSAAFVISLLLSLDVKVPSPAVPIEKAIKTIMGK